MIDNLEELDVALRKGEVRVFEEKVGGPRDSEYVELPYLTSPRSHRAIRLVPAYIGATSPTAWYTFDRWYYSPMLCAYVLSYSWFSTE